MCGLAGVVATGGGIAGRHDGLAAAILFRGRDEQASWTDGERVLLEQSRLSIIDVVGGHQPMTDASGRYTIVYNGEVYNYIELRQRFEGMGARFRTRSDTEVVLEGFKLLGPDVCRELNGMFAFAVWDAVERTLVLARDHLGKKPLFWADVAGTFVFASTLDALRTVPGFDDRLSRAGVSAYRLLGSFPEDRTIYEGASAIPHASYGVLRPGDRVPRLSRYWRMEFRDKLRGSARELEAAYLDLLEDAVRIRLRSDVPLALTFSGGVDSGTIAALTTKRLGADVRCYTIDRHTAEDPSPETITAERVAAHLGLDLHHIDYDFASDLLPMLDAAYRWYDQPSAMLPLVYVDELYRVIRPHATVVLSGNGADELFTGYIGDERLRRQDLLLRLARPLRRLLPASAPSYARMPTPAAYSQSVARRAASFAVDDVEAATEIGRQVGAEAEVCGVENRLDLQMYLALTVTTADSNYRLPDISGLANQVEVRSPYLDHRLVELAARLPHRYKIGRPWTPTANKWLPRRAYERMVPKDVAWGPKRGMGWNLRWDLQLGHDHFRQAFADAFDALDERGLGSAHPRALYADHLAREATGGRSAEMDALMSSFMLGRWLRRGSGPLV